MNAPMAVTGGGNPLRKVRLIVSAAIAGNDVVATLPATAAMVAAPSKLLFFNIIISSLLFESLLHTPFDWLKLRRFSHEFPHTSMNPSPIWPVG
jgi:hypothetical protein